MQMQIDKVQYKCIVDVFLPLVLQIIYKKVKKSKISKFTGAKTVFLPVVYRLFCSNMYNF